MTVRKKETNKWDPPLSHPSDRTRFKNLKLLKKSPIQRISFQCSRRDANISLNHLKLQLQLCLEKIQLGKNLHDFLNQK